MLDDREVDELGQLLKVEAKVSTEVPNEMKMVAAALHEVAKLPEDVEPDENAPEYTCGKEVSAESIGNSEATSHISAQILEVLNSGQMVNIKAHGDTPERTLYMDEGKIFEMDKVSAPTPEPKVHGKAREIARRLKRMLSKVRGTK